ncbi:MAG TPA: GNAT family N-acetyltransferase [Candidatus Sulfotelmatobacter sp.]|nr:GNAT family N-acetyltransferase [Candidatus Sulfotelmatobacter sp.]
MKCDIVDFESADHDELDRYADRTVFQTRAWVRFIGEAQKATPILAKLHEDGKVAGYFTGLTIERFGVKVLGSSFPGWTTPYIGFNLSPGVSRAAALAAVEKMAWNDLKCLHLEVSDPFFTVEDGQALGFQCDSFASYRSDLTRTEEEIFQSMDSACRRCIRKAEKSGVAIEEAHDKRFAEEYYEQLKDVFAKQGLVPTYGIDRVRALIKHVEPSGNLLLLRARDAEGKCIATGVFPGFNQIAEFWGNASWRSSQILRPNEAMHWYAMRYWKKRGVAIYDWGGEGSYKEKYGCIAHKVPWFTKSRYQFVSKLRDEAKKMFGRKQRFMGWLQKQRTTPAEPE